MSSPQTLTARPPAVQSAGQYHYAIGYLRAFLVLLVVAHHAALAYHPSAPLPPVSLDALPRWWQAFPVVDPQRAAWTALFVGFNDTFFMALMFLLSGLFVASGLKHKGAGGFLRGRLLRLGVPFLFAAAAIAPLAYYPTYLQMAGHTGAGGFLREWLTLGAWPAGPAWFIWVLLVFDCIAALLFAVWPQWAATLGGFLAGPRKRPVRLFLVLAIVSAAVYVPLELTYSGLSWAAFGPFTFQTARILHYLCYFLAGAGLGALGLDRGPLAPDGKLARRWPLWAIAAILVSLTLSTVAILFITAHLQSRAWEVSTDLLFAASCATSSFAFLALFLRFVRSRSKVFTSLSRNSYGIYLVHYAFVSWIQLALVATGMPATIKFAVVVCGAVAGSWLTVIALRRIPAVARVV
ncbi:MAG TPA: acyltransferase [Bryobacteraceae bacterium]|jgi:peptidoglycan/LPS O-acetylase OafA/YrhL|nr:acyltransferase [Bryobacteraceae bacterium]